MPNDSTIQQKAAPSVSILTNPQAEVEYEKSAQHRRVSAEAEGMKQLEDAARELAKRKRTRRRKQGN